MHLLVEEVVPDEEFLSESSAFGLGYQSPMLDDVPQSPLLRGWQAAMLDDEAGGTATATAVETQTVTEDTVVEPVVGSGNAYSVAYQMRMELPAEALGTRYAHFSAANVALFNDMDTDPAFAATVREMIPDIDSIRGTGEAPSNWVWNHLASEPGVMQLVPSVQHWSSNPLWSIFHPLINGKNVGGFKLCCNLYLYIYRLVASIMTLEEIIGNLDNIDNSLTICAARSPSWTRTSEAELCPAVQVPKKCKLPYFLEVSVAKNVLRAWSYARAGRIPDIARKCEAIIYYAENDAYIPPSHGD